MTSFLLWLASVAVAFGCGAYFHDGMLVKWESARDAVEKFVRGF